MHLCLGSHTDAGFFVSRHWLPLIFEKGNSHAAVFSIFKVFFYFIGEMGSFFSRHKSRVTEHDKAVLQLKQQRDELKRHRRRTTDSIERDTATIKELYARKLTQYVFIVQPDKWEPRGQRSPRSGCAGLHFRLRGFLDSRGPAPRF